MTILNLTGGNITLLIAAHKNSSPYILYLGQRLPPNIDPETVSILSQRLPPNGVADLDLPVTLAGETGTGYLGTPGLEVHCDGIALPMRLIVDRVEEQDHTLHLTTGDHNHNIRVTYSFDLEPDSDTIRVQTVIRNDSQSMVNVDAASTINFSASGEWTQVLAFSGRWAAEFQAQRSEIPTGGFCLDNRRGRTGHDRSPSVILCASSTTETQGACLGLHLGWSGNYRIRTDKNIGGEVAVQAGPMFDSAEIALDPGEELTLPPAFLSYSKDGLSKLSQNFHDFVRKEIIRQTTQQKPRPVHYNTWEGIYFNHDADTLSALVKQAAALGVERFVLDDGWFLGRRDDCAGLGDWQVDPEVYPDGLNPLIKSVNDAGMEFGLWVEPEMVNVDSNLFRQHPDWVLGGKPESQVPFRQQYVLDLTRSPVTDYLFGQLDDLLNSYPGIKYLKWDMNRDLNHPDSNDGKASVFTQTKAVYALIERLRSCHPDVEIESCASGGARVDYGILSHTDRFWTSDSNDAIDRHHIQRGASFFFPLCMMGAHVGPYACHITGRHLSMEFRAATAMFGHMGVEANLLEMSESDVATLKRAIALYKEYRDDLHSGLFYRLDLPDWQDGIGVVSADKNTALYRVSALRSPPGPYGGAYSPCWP